MAYGFSVVSVVLFHKGICFFQCYWYNFKAHISLNFLYPLTFARMWARITFSIYTRRPAILRDSPTP